MSRNDLIILFHMFRIFFHFSFFHTCLHSVYCIRCNRLSNAWAAFVLLPTIFGESLSHKMCADEPARLFSDDPEWKIKSDKNKNAENLVKWIRFVGRGLRVSVSVYARVRMDMRWHAPTEYLNKYANNLPQIKTYVTSTRNIKHITANAAIHVCLPCAAITDFCHAAVCMNKWIEQSSLKRLLQRTTMKIVDGHWQQPAIWWHCGMGIELLLIIVGVDVSMFASIQWRSRRIWSAQLGRPYTHAAQCTLTHS